MLIWSNIISQKRHRGLVVQTVTAESQGFVIRYLELTCGAKINSDLHAELKDFITSPPENMLEEMTQI